MALVLADRVKETTGSTGTGDVSLAGATTGFQRFADAVGDSNTTYYAISLVGGGEFEVGLGTYIAATNSLRRDTVFQSSNSDSLVDFSTGTKDVFVVYPSDRAVVVEGTTVNIPNSATVPVTSGGTGADNASTARSNLGLGSAAVEDDTRYAHRSNNLSDLDNASTARSNLGLEIGVDVQAYDVNTAKYNDPTAEFTGILSAGTVYAGELKSGAALTWDSSSDTYSRDSTYTTNATPVHEGMKRCLLLDDGTVNYYLDQNDSTLKEDGTAADLSGTDGMVMVEIPKFYFRFEFEGNKRIWKVSDLPLAGYQLHPAFFKNGEIVDYRYMGAYDACVYDDSADTYIAGLNLDENIGNVDLSNDKLASVSGIYPMVGLERDEFRALAANRGAGWRQQDFWLTSAVQMLYLVEYGDFNSQANLGDGNVNGGYTGGSADQNDSPHTVAGASNGFGNASTDGSQPSAGAKPGTAYMSYRGIENFYGNCWDFVDGFNIIDLIGYVNNDDTTFADDTTTNYEQIGDAMPSSNNYVTDIQNIGGAFIPASVGGSSSTFLSDYFFQRTGNRVARFGSNAARGAQAGAFCWNVDLDSSNDRRRIGGRLSF